MIRDKSMLERIRGATSREEVERLLGEAEDYRYARPATERRIRRAAQQKRKDLK